MDKVIPALQPIDVSHRSTEAEKQYKLKWRRLHGKEAAARKKIWRAANKDRINAEKREWRAKNAEHVRLMNKKWRDEHPEQTAATEKRSRIKNAAKFKVWHTNYRKTSEKRRRDLAMSNKKYAKKPEVVLSNLRSHLKRTFGMTLEEYNERLLKQDGKCAICGKTNNSGKRLFVDHCHKTGKIRGLLCGPCNNAIGLFYDDPELMNKAAAYLKYQ